MMCYVSTPYVTIPPSPPQKLKDVAERVRFASNARVRMFEEVKGWLLKGDHIHEVRVAVVIMIMVVAVVIVVGG